MPLDVDRIKIMNLKGIDMWPFKQNIPKENAIEEINDIIIHDGDVYRIVQSSSQMYTKDCELAAKEGLVCINMSYVFFNEPRGWTFTFLKIDALRQNLPSKTD